MRLLAGPTLTLSADYLGVLYFSDELSSNVGIHSFHILMSSRKLLKDLSITLAL